MLRSLLRLKRPAVATAAAACPRCSVSVAAAARPLSSLATAAWPLGHRRREAPLPAPRRGLASLALNQLAPADGSTKKRKRVGRGRGSGMGKTSRRGHKGAKARSGYSLNVGFEGGQMPMKKRVPKYGSWSNHMFRLDYQTVSIARILNYVDRGLLDASAPITMKDMHDSGLLKVAYPGVKLLSDGADWLAERDDVVLQLEVSRTSTVARNAVEASGGAVSTLYLNKLGYRAYLKPHKYEPHTLPRRASIPYRLQKHYPFESHGHLYTPYRLKGPEISLTTGKLVNPARLEDVPLGRGDEFAAWLASRTDEELAPPEDYLSVLRARNEGTEEERAAMVNPRSRESVRKNRETKQE